jgi:glycopeptide antibiotics resistance protein
MPTVRPSPHGRRALLAALAGYSVLLALVLGWPTPVDAPVAGTLRGLLVRLHELGVPAWVTYGKVEFGANIALFVPLGLLLALLLRRRHWWLAAVSGLGLSLLAEIGQAALRPHRLGSLRDVLANTLGTVIGAGLVALARRRRAGQVR